MPSLYEGDLAPGDTIGNLLYPFYYCTWSISCPEFNYKLVTKMSILLQTVLAIYNGVQMVIKVVKGDMNG